MPFCTHCRSPNRAGARYCNACGGLLPGAACPQCGGPNREGAHYCDACGAVLRGRMEPRRLLLTLLFTDIVDSTRREASLGDRAWHELLTRHHALIRSHLERHAGRELDTAGDGFFARFDGPADALPCAREIVDGVAALGLDVRVGIHTGECELFEHKVGGIAVAISSRVCGAAEAGEILVTSTVRDLAAGSQFGFVDRGVHELKGVPASWRLFAIA